MDSDFLTKNPTMLPCPCCHRELDAGASMRTMRQLKQQQFTCAHCGVALEKKTKNFGSAVFLLLPLLISLLRLNAPWSWALPLALFCVYFFLIGKEIQSAHLALIAREPS